MICLDTNYLILGLVEGSQEMSDLIAWSRAGEELVAPSVAWYEFLCGPVTQPQIRLYQSWQRKRLRSRLAMSARDSWSEN